MDVDNHNSTETAPLASSVPIVPVVTAAGQIQRPLTHDAVDGWSTLHARLCSTLNSSADGADFEKRLSSVVSGLRDEALARPDESLFVLVQTLFDTRVSYSATHALLCALMCQLTASSAEIPEQEEYALVCAALTMNIGMTATHDQLARQPYAPSAAQRAEIEAHPDRGIDILRERGIQDDIWLDLVRDHHETLDGLGYPGGKTDLGLSQQLLHMVDVFAAGISPRKGRRGLAPSAAVANAYIKAQEHNSALGAIFVKHMGKYLPGTYVKLKNEEIALVVKRGERIHTPTVMAIADGQGMPFTTPRRRDTQLSMYAVMGTLAPQDVRISVDVARLLKRV